MFEIFIKVCYFQVQSYCYGCKGYEQGCFLLSFRNISVNFIKFMEYFICKI